MLGLGALGHPEGVRRRTVLAILVLALTGAAALTAPAGARPSQRMLFEAPRELLAGDDALRAATLDEIQELGAGWLRIVMYWQDVAPDPDGRRVPRFDERDPAGYDWSRYDAAIVAAHERGMQILLTISGPVPRWATRGQRDHRTRPSPVRFGRFAEAVGSRYGDVVDTWSIWNEPNHPRFLLPQWTRQHGRREATSARLYRGLFQAGERALRRGDNRHDTILMGETAPRGSTTTVAPLTFMRRALCLDERWRRTAGCHRLAADGYAHHAYTPRSGPFFEPERRDEVTIGVLGRLDTALDRAGRAGAIRKGMPIWLTEFGIQSTPDPYLGVSQTRQAEYRAIAERMATRNARVVAFSQYLMRDDDPTVDASGRRSYGGFETGLRTAQGRAKRSFAAFRLPLVAIRGPARTTLWGRVRPATRVTTVSIDFRAPGGRRWHLLKRDRTDSRGLWTTTTRLAAGRRYRVRWTSPEGRRLSGPLTRSYRAP